MNSTKKGQYNKMKYKLSLSLLVVATTSLVFVRGETPASSTALGFNDPGYCQSGALIRDGCGATFKAVEDMNRKVRPIIQDLVTEDYFRYYKVDLSEEKCPFKDFNLGMCGNRACVVDPVEDESEIPEFWRTKYLGKLANNSVSKDPYWKDGKHHVSCSCLGNNDASINSPSGEPVDDDEANYCYPEDESQSAPGVWVSLLDNPERFTGYAGAHANKVWRAVYQENCFGYYGDADGDGAGHTNVSRQGLSATSPTQPQQLAEHQLSEAIMGANRHDILEVGGEAGREAMNVESQCVEQRLFFRLLSGMHASVSTHLCFDYLHKSTGKWAPNLECFNSRVGQHPERLSNLYFNYALVARAVAKLRYYIDDLYFCIDDRASDQSTRKQLLKLTKAAVAHEEGSFNETNVFSSPEGRSLKDEFRKRVRNVSGLMSCVGCERCRLWGKLQVAGYGTALKILFELPERPSDDPELSSYVMSHFRRTELIALINTFDRLSKSIYAVNQFRRLSDSEGATPTPLVAREEKATAVPEWDPEFALAWDGLKFILRSYIEFPKNIWSLFIHYSALYWNKFIGRHVEVTSSRVRTDL